MTRNIFDAHSHIGRFGSQKAFGYTIKPFDNPVGTVEKYAAFVKKHDLTYALCSPNYSTDAQMPFQLNDLVLEAVQKIDNVFGALWVSPVEETWPLMQEILASKPADKIKALKLSPTVWPESLSPNPSTWSKSIEKNFEELLHWAEKNKLVLQFHTGSGNADILEFEPFIEKYSGKLSVQLVHMGGITSGHFKFVPRFQKWIETGLRVYCDTSFTRDFAPGWLLRELMEKDAGLDRVMFASDFPWGLMEPALARIDCLALPEDIQEKVFFKNAEKLYLK